MTAPPEVTSETEGAAKWRKIKAGMISAVARLALYAFIFALWAVRVVQG